MSMESEDPRLEVSGSSPDRPINQNQDTSDDLCRICRCDGEDDPLFQPCLCSGSIQSVHEQCLLTWLEHRGHDACELCGEKYGFVKKYSDDMPEKIPVSAYMKSLWVILKEVMGTVLIVIRSIGMIIFTLDALLILYYRGTATVVALVDNNKYPAFFSVLAEFFSLKRLAIEPCERPWLFDNPAWIDNMGPVFRHFFSTHIDGLTVVIITFVVLLISYMTIVWILSDSALLHDISHLNDGQVGHLDPGGTREPEGFWTDTFFFGRHNKEFYFDIDDLNERARVGLIKEACGDLVNGELETPSYGTMDEYLEKMGPKLTTGYLDDNTHVVVESPEQVNYNWGPQAGWESQRLRINAPRDLKFPRDSAEMIALAWGFDEFSPSTAFPSKAASTHFGLYFEALMVEWQKVNNLMLTEAALMDINLMRKLSQRKIAIEMEVNDLSQIARNMGEEDQRAKQVDIEARAEAVAQGLGDEPNNNPPVQDDVRWLANVIFGGPLLEKIKYFAVFLTLMIVIISFFYLGPLAVGRAYRINSVRLTDAIVNRLTGNTLELGTFSHSLTEAWRDVTHTVWLSPPVGFAAEFALGCCLLFMAQYWVYYYSLNWLIRDPNKRVFAITLKRSTACASIITVFAIELIAFPIYAGALLHLALLPLVENSAAFTPVATYESSPHLSVVLWHLSGLIYVYLFGAFLRLMRTNLRDGALYFVQDPTDPKSQPVRMILTQGLVSHMRKVSVSMLLYIGFLLGGVGLPAILTRATGILPNIFAPLRINYISGSELFDLWPLVIVCITYFDGLKQQSRAIWKWQRDLWEDYIKRVARSVGLRSFLLGEPEPSSLRHSGAGYFMVAPRCGMFERSRDVKLFTSVEDLDAGRWYGSGMAEGFHARYAIVWRPKEFRWRLATFIALMWAAASLEVALVIAVPLTTARNVMWLLGCEDALQNDCVRLVVSWVCLLLCSCAIKRWATGEHAEVKIEEDSDENGETYVEGNDQENAHESPEGVAEVESEADAASAGEGGIAESAFVLSLLDSLSNAMFYGTIIHLLGTDDTSFWWPSLKGRLYLLAYMLWLWPSKEPAVIDLSVVKIINCLIITQAGHYCGLGSTPSAVALALLIPFYEYLDARPRFIRDLLASWPQRAKDDVYLVRRALQSRPR